MQEAQFLDVFAVGMETERALRMLETLSHKPIDKEILLRALHVLKEHLFANFTTEEETLFHAMTRETSLTKEEHELLKKQALEHQHIRTLSDKIERLTHMKGKERLLPFAVGTLASVIRTHQVEEQERVEKVFAYMQKSFLKLYHQMHEEI